MQDSQVVRERNPTPRRAVMAAWLTPLVLLSLLVAVGVAGSSPRACVVCHARQGTALADGPHSETSCYACHLDRGSWSLAEHKVAELTRMYPLALIGGEPAGPARLTDRRACLRCHRTLSDSVTARNGFRIDHESCASAPSCDPCHSTAAHGKAVRWVATPLMDDCIRCHERSGASNDCEICHEGDRVQRVGNKGPWQVTHGPEWRTTHGMGEQATCRTCHATDFCAKCHGVAVPHPVDFGATHGQAAREGIDRCLVCHKSRKSFCDACHGMDMPHEDFVAQHVVVARNRTDPRCVRCHVETDCASCHSLHIHPGGAKGVPVPWTQTPEARRP